MSYIDTVTTLALARNRGGRPITEATKQRRAAQGVREQNNDPSDKKPLPGAQLSIGQQGGYRLEKDRSSYRWTAAIKDGRAVPRLGVREGAGAGVKQLLPASRKVDAPVQVDTTSSLEYLRQMCSKYEHLGLDELVGPELVAAADDQWETTDVYKGSTLSVVHHAHAKLAQSLMLYKSGELGNELGIAAFAPKSNTVTQRRPLSRFIASSLPLETFPTEILQIDTSSALPRDRNTPQGTSLAVRLHSTTHLFSMVPDRGFKGSPDLAPVSLIHIGSLPSAATGRRRHVDMAVDPAEWGRIAVIDDQGGVWMWSASSGDGEMDLVSLRPPTTKHRESFFRIAWGTSPGTLLVVSDREAVSLDVEDLSHPSKSLLQVPSTSMFLDIDKTASAREATLTCLVSSEEIIWIDESRAGQSTLRWKHDMGDVPGLRVIVHSQTTHDCYILFSPTSSTLTCFHISESTPIRMLCPPYTVSLPSASPAMEYATIDLQRNTDHPSDTMLLASSAEGAVTAIPVIFGPKGDDEGSQDPRVRADLTAIWDAGLEDIELHGPEEGLPAEGMDKRPAARSIYDGRWVWEAINAEHNDPEAVITAHRLAKYLRQLDAPLEQLITGAELARDAAMGSSEDQVRTHNLRRLLVPEADAGTLEAFDDLKLDADLVPVSRIAFTAHHVTGYSEGILSTSKQVYDALLAAYLPESQGEATRADHHSRERKHAAALALDLALSSHVLSSEELPTATDDTSQPFQTPEDVLEQAARLTLNDQNTPKVSLQYFRSAETAEADGEYSALPRPTIQQATIQQLLSEWTTRGDPRAYEWKPWVNLDDETGTADMRLPNRPIRPLPSPRGSPRPAQSQYAAPVFAPTASRLTAGTPSIYSQPGRTQATPAVTYSLPNLPSRKGVPGIISHTQTSRLASPRPSPPPSPAPAAMTPNPGRAANVSPTIRRQAARSPETNVGQLFTPAVQAHLAATQIERGPFGGRPPVGNDKKKKPKKRLGGF